MTGIELDFYLSLGYFRMQQQVFTCQYVVFDDTLCPVHWLRLVLPELQYGPRQRDMLKRNRRFSVRVVPFRLNDELEALYARYLTGIDFDAPVSVADCLLGTATYNVFDTRVVEVRDNDRLIAAGVFDTGQYAIAGIMNFYDPDYRKQSLGKFLMLQKIEYARQQHKLFYYPGYIVSGNPKFDYKLFVDEAATYVFDDNTGEWLPFSWELIRSMAAGKLTD